MVSIASPKPNCTKAGDLQSIKRRRSPPPSTLSQRRPNSQLKDPWSNPGSVSIPNTTFACACHTRCLCASQPEASCRSAEFVGQEIFVGTTCCGMRLTKLPPPSLTSRESRNTTSFVWLGFGLEGPNGNSVSSGHHLTLTSRANAVRPCEKLDEDSPRTLPKAETSAHRRHTTARLRNRAHELQTHVGPGWAQEPVTDAPPMCASGVSTTPRTSGCRVHPVAARPLSNPNIPDSRRGGDRCLF